MKHYKRKVLNIGIANLIGLTVLTLGLMSLFSFQSTAEDTNQAHPSLIHYRVRGYESDIISDVLSPMTDQWAFYVKNPVDSGGEVEIVRFTACCEPAISWPDEPPYSEFSPCNGWDYGYVWNGPWLVPEDTMYGIHGEGTQGTTEKPDVIVTRVVAPSILDASETVQVVNVEVTYTEMPPMGGNVAIGAPNVAGDEPLVKTEIVSQNDLPNWQEMTAMGEAHWNTPPENIEIGVPYNFIAEIRSIKSPLIIGDPVWKPMVHVQLGDVGLPSPDPSIGTSYSLLHPDGVKVTFEATNEIEWIPTLEAGKSLFLVQVISEQLYPCNEDGEYCEDGEYYCVPEDRDGDGIWDEVDNCPFTPNPEQEDSNGDGIGDACDVGGVNIDIKPGSYPNSINLKSKGKVPVAILTTDTFDATTVDSGTVRFGKTGTEASPVHYATEDVDGDGDTDMILHFKTQQTGIQYGDTFAFLIGNTFSLQVIKGADSVRIRK